MTTFPPELAAFSQTESPADTCSTRSPRRPVPGMKGPGLRDAFHACPCLLVAEAGVVTPVIDVTYPLSDTPEALRYLDEEHARGKVVITV